MKNYAQGVQKLFSKTSRAQIMSVEAGEETDMITITWRLSGSVNIGSGIPIKPYIVYTDYRLDEEGLIVYQEDRYLQIPPSIYFYTVFTI